jgi:hypothetical protein
MTYAIIESTSKTKVATVKETGRRKALLAFSRTLSTPTQLQHSCRTPVLLSGGKVYKAITK